MSRMMSSFVVCILALLFAATTVSYPPRCARAAKPDDLTARQFEDVNIEAQSMGSLLEKFSLAYDIPVGFEAASNDDERARYQFDFKKGSLSELLNQFVARHDQYAWEIIEGVVNIFPKDNYRDPLFRIYWQLKSTGLQSRRRLVV